jgi:hypothetical protein
MGGVVGAIDRGERVAQLCVAARGEHAAGVAGELEGDAGVGERA